MDNETMAEAIEKLRHHTTPQKQTRKRTVYGNYKIRCINCECWDTSDLRYRQTVNNLYYCKRRRLATMYKERCKDFVLLK
jgi:hypothetical protein